MTKMLTSFAIALGFLLACDHEPIARELTATTGCDSLPEGTPDVFRARCELGWDFCTNLDPACDATLANSIETTYTDNIQGNFARNHSELKEAFTQICNSSPLCENHLRCRSASWNVDHPDPCPRLQP